jgi:hypothetical protein
MDSFIVFMAITIFTIIAMVFTGGRRRSSTHMISFVVIASCGWFLLTGNSVLGIFGNETMISVAENPGIDSIENIPKEQVYESPSEEYSWKPDRENSGTQFFMFLIAIMGISIFVLIKHGTTLWIWWSGLFMTKEQREQAKIERHARELDKLGFTKEANRIRGKKDGSRRVKKNRRDGSKSLSRRT